jgi:hypothetical protein
MAEKVELWDELIQDVEDLNKEIGNVVYILIADDIMIGSTRKSDINEHLAMDKSFVPEFILQPNPEHQTIEGIELIHGAVLNPLELPMELPKSFENYNIWLIKDDKSIRLIGAIEYEMFDIIEEVADSIESTLERDPSVQIEDFAIIVGNQIDLILQADTSVESISVREII